MHFICQYHFPPIFYFLNFLFFQLQLTYSSIFVSGVQHSDETHLAYEVIAPSPVPSDTTQSSQRHRLHSLRCTPHPSHDCFYNWQFVHLNPFPFSTRPPQTHSHLATIKMFSVSRSLLLFCLFCSLDSTHRWNHTAFVVFCLTYFTQHNSLQVTRQLFTEHLGFAMRRLCLKDVRKRSL